MKDEVIRPKVIRPYADFRRRAIAKAREEEREACAKIAEEAFAKENARQEWDSPSEPVGYVSECSDIAAAIRERGDHVKEKG